MKPLRMCMVCRERREKKDLIRVAYQKDRGAVIDPVGKLPGRGAYVCRRAECIAQAQKRRVLERAFSAAVESGIYEALKEEGYES